MVEFSGTISTRNLIIQQEAGRFSNLWLYNIINKTQSTTTVTTDVMEVASAHMSIRVILNMNSFKSHLTTCRNTKKREKERSVIKREWSK